MTSSSLAFPLLIIIGLAVIAYLLFSNKPSTVKRHANSATKTRHKRKRHKKAHH
ncbi:hypothetical protein [Ferrimonas lipolytica]|uniref:Uncharacterized protein n=1 Tax=Ferrimonas lipolytica TaxID=2724191 RepID=A0A6H1UK27_9GAMM|nr:hypothetical protein [Ferrimonas lipolytica]QIZ78576.1 hypothetical protein HER31_17720 [Ferrimonas lipolytica]